MMGKDCWRGFDWDLPDYTAVTALIKQDGHHDSCNLCHAGIS
jgi:hypothetical protein